ncbi:MAG TPA: crossover junction endodeoxyribonuclease RuvC, partial [Holophagaceae bacterium]|nr:crossover junction endodeoxyribonuclease RuvC [Holophagaceae bacterium]
MNGIIRCLGVDPGSLACGFAVVERNGSRMSLVEAGVIRSPRGQDFDQRIHGIHLRLSEAIAAHAPAFMAVESPFVEKNAATALKLGQIRGGILLTAALHGLPVGDYNPMQVKKAVSGYGWADKTQVGKMVMTLLGVLGQYGTSGDCEATTSRNVWSNSSRMPCSTRALSALPCA